MPPVNVLIKPASSHCNLRCQYCFYHDEAAKRKTFSYGVMREETIEAIISKALAHASRSCTFGFQGGEPTLAGLDFFEHVIDLQKRYNTKGLNIYNALQTNGTQIDDEWASFFAKNQFLIGVSLDGHESLHNLYRKDEQGNGTFGRVMQGIETLKRNDVEFNILTVVTAQTAKHIKEVYAFFKKHGLKYQQYVPCFEPIGERRTKQRYSLTPQLYARFLKNLFDLWYKDREAGEFAYNRYFENLAAILLGYKPESCDMNGVCSLQYAFEADGSAYPCDFYMLDDYCIGNINIDSMEDIYQNCYNIGFIQQSAKLPTECQNCQWLDLCRNGCLRNRLQVDSFDAGLNYYCDAFKEFFPYILPNMGKIIRGRKDQ